MNIVTVMYSNTSLRLQSTTFCENLVKVKHCRAIERRFFEGVISLHVFNDADWGGRHSEGDTEPWGV